MFPRKLPRPAFRPAFTGALILVLAAGAIADARPSTQPMKFADPAFERAWQRTDLPVANGQVARTWFWGPQPGVSKREFFQGSGAGHLVQYFDKARMEINDPKADPNSPWYVTNGLLTVELIMGELIGDPTAHMPPGPADIPLASDLDDPNAPTYQSFRSVADVPGSGSHVASPATGQAVVTTIDRAGQVGKDPSKAALGDAVKYAYFEPATKHNIAGAFWEFLNRTDLVYENGKLKQGRLSDPWFYATGYPISEAYWARVRIGVQRHDVLIQAFQRRVLTYVPDNPAAWRVQMGNIGQHYYQWRYGSAMPVNTVGPAPSTIPGGRIVFVSTRAGSPDVFTMAPDGSGVRQVAGTPGSNLAPRFAPGGKAIAYCNLPPGTAAPAGLDSPGLPSKARIMLTGDAAGSAGYPLGATSVPSWDAQADPAYSPGSTFLAFRGKPAGEEPGIFIANMASDAPFIPVTRLTTSAWDRQPVWSPDGKTIAFTSGSSADDSQIWAISANGTGRHSLTAAVHGRFDVDPAWSPDGKRIAYASASQTGKYDIAQVSSDGVAGSKLTGGQNANQRHPGYSTDGSWLVFSSDKDGNQEIFVAPADALSSASGWTNISRSPSTDGQPGWGK